MSDEDKAPLISLSKNHDRTLERSCVVGTSKYAIHYALCYMPVMTESITGVDSHIISKSSGYMEACMI